MKLTLGWKQVRGLCAMGALVSLVGLTGCPFFVCEGKADCGTSSTSTGTGDYVYVSNSTSGPNYIAAYEIGTNSLTGVSGTPFPVGYTPVGMKVSPNNNFLYVAAAGGGGLYVYNIDSSTGALSNATQLVQNTEFDSLDISPDGNYLVALSYTVLAGEALTEYSLDTITGAISGTGGTSFPLPTGTICTLQGTPVSQTCTVAVSPSGDFVGVAAGAEGTVIFPYSSTSGITSSYTGMIPSPSQGSADYSVAFDESGFVYIARTSELAVYGTLSAASPSSGTTYMGYAGTAMPRSVTFSSSYNYVFTADEGTSQISAFNVSNGVLTAFTTPTYLGPGAVSALGVDRSGAYLLAAGYSTVSGLQLFPIASTGLTATTSEPTGASQTVPVVMALTHS